VDAPNFLLGIIIYISFIKPSTYKPSIPHIIVFISSKPKYTPLLMSLNASRTFYLSSFYAYFRCFKSSNSS